MDLSGALASICTESVNSCSTLGATFDYAYIICHLFHNQILSLLLHIVHAIICLFFEHGVMLLGSK
jgi:hypothetical protein